MIESMDGVTDRRLSGCCRLVWLRRVALVACVVPSRWPANLPIKTRRSVRPLTFVTDRFCFILSCNVFSVLSVWCVMRFLCKEISVPHLRCVFKWIHKSVLLKPNPITLSWSQTAPRLVAGLQWAGIWPITHYLPCWQWATRSVTSLGPVCG